MSLDFRAVFSQILIFFGRFSKKQKIVIFSAVALLIALVIFLIVAGGGDKRGRGDYVVLFDGLNSQDSAAAIEYLKHQSSTYILSDDGKILVPRSRVYEDRIALASQGIPKSSKVGFEIFDNQSFATTDAEHQVKFLRATEGELSRSIESLSPIRSANVILAIPKSSVFVSEQIPPTASVVLNIKPGFSLTHSQIFGIKNLVSSAVPRLIAENVKIVNQNGEPLGDNDDLSASQDRVSMQLKYKRNIEQLLESKVINILSPIVGGQDKVVARVTADFDFSSKKSLQEIYDPNNVVRSEQSIEEKKQGTQQQIGGVPGAVSNIGPVQGLDGNTKDNYSKTQNTTNYEVGKTINEVMGEFGTLKRLSAAVVVDGKYKVDGKSVEYIPLSSDALQKINDLVKQAIGFNVARGDDVSVSNFEFGAPKDLAKSQAEQILNEAKDYIAPYSTLIKYAFALLVLFVFYRKVVVPFMQRMLETQKPKEEPIEPLFEDIDSLEDERRLNDLRRRVEDNLELSNNFSEEHIKYDILLERTRALIEEKPEEIAQIIKTLVKDEVEESK